ncbi:nicotinate-nucleotide adenylyltransferase [Anoxybacterium hadale]|uniref:Nicotinate-nucleotide adenylyltransferase n=1 Tax=Anoxybacterium hadale TaxID=3408580 RepID=A0ACD1A8E7_9FIRM|nr:nicotinate-nucleotide adenylyltransferase [Clostridiales bacterium]
MKKIGIIGGTFDPVHYGHLILAEQARVEAALDRVVFMPAMVQPFKLHTKSAEGDHRYAMLLEAVSGNPYFSVSRKELDSPDISYTIHTLKSLKEEMGEDAELYFIIGTDAFLSLEKWYSAEELLRNFSFVIGMRPGYKEQELKEMIDHVREIYGTRVAEINNSEVEISSSDIKERIRTGKSIKYLLPDGVESYIRNNGLYTVLD